MPTFAGSYKKQENSRKTCTYERIHFHFSLSYIGEGHGNPLQCSCLENPRDGGTWWAAICGVAQSRTRLMRLSSSSSSRVIDISWPNFSIIVSNRRGRPRERGRDGGAVRTHTTVMDYVHHLTWAQFMAPQNNYNSNHNQ